MRLKLLLATAVVMESASWFATFGTPDPWGAPLFALSHAVASLCLGFGLRGYLPERFRTKDRRELLVLIGPALFIPLAGVPAVLLFALWSLTPTKELDRGPPFRLTEIPGLPASAAPASKTSVFSDFNLAAALRHGREPAMRLRAVLAAGLMKDPAGVSILALGLKDRDDEVRLLSYALLDSKEREIYTRIKEDTARLEKVPEEGKGRVHARLAHHHWEMVYMGIAHGEVGRHLLSEARKHAEHALERSPRDGGTQLLLGRILLKQGALDEARQAFNRALESGLCDAVVLPYLAEIGFKQRKFDEVREHIRVLGTRGNLPPTVVGFWS